MKVLSNFLVGLIFQVVFTAYSAHAQAYYSTTSRSLAHLQYTASSDAESVFNAPLIISADDANRKWALSFSHNQPFGLQDLRQNAFAIIRYRSKVNYGLGIAHMGFDSFSEWFITSSFSRELLEALMIGLGSAHHIQRFGSISRRHHQIRVALKYRFNEDFNLYSAHLLESSLKEHLNFMWGVHWKLHPLLHFFVERQNDALFDPSWVISTKLHVSKNRFTFHAGYNTAQALVAAGIDISFSSFRMSLAYSSHAILGASHALSMHWMP